MSDAGMPQAGACGPLLASPVRPDARLVVLDTNIALDLDVFDDPRSAALVAQLDAGELCWIATAEMAAELRHVLDYPHIARRSAQRGLDAKAVMQRHARRVRLVEAAPRAPVVCRDPDDQKFIDLAFARGAMLISRDRQVLKTARRALRHGVVIAADLQAASEKLSGLQRSQ